MDKEKQIKRIVKAKLSTSVDDWPEVRECFLASFRRYPLYKYMVPDESKRDAFLRAYLQANYEVTVGSGQGILVMIKASDNGSSFKIVGGVIFLPPSSSGSGWAIENDEPYWKAYEEHGLARISKDGFDRVKRYEAWENEEIAQQASATKIPLWNGLFCAIAPEYSSQGVGTAAYKQCIHIMAKHSTEMKKKSVKMDADDRDQEIKDNFLNRLRRIVTSKQNHRFTLLHHRLLPHAAMVEKIDQNDKVAPKNFLQKDTCDNIPEIPLSTSEEPLMAVISQSDRAARFHQSNGLQPIMRIPYHDHVDGDMPFYTHLLLMDPFRTGRIDEFKSKLYNLNNNAKQKKHTPDWLIETNPASSV